MVLPLPLIKLLKIANQPNFKAKMLKKIVKKIIGESNVYYLRDKWSAQKNTVAKKKRVDFYSQFISKDDLCFDVGANYGNRIEALLELGCRIVAIEPQHECCKFLKKKYGSSIEIINKGLGEKEGSLEFYKSDASTLSTFSKDWIEAVQQSGRFRQHHWEKKTIVDMTTLDNLIRLYGLPQFVKIDVEGYELEVLKGLSSPVRFISFEYAVPEQIEKIAGCIQHIQSLAPGKKAECNYSVGESMAWTHNSWLPCADMIDLIHTAEFIDTGFGDIYVRTI